MVSVSVLAQSEKQAIEHFNQATEAFKAKEYKSAIQSYTEAITIKPDYAKAYYNRGNAKLNLKNYKSALIDFKKTCDLDDQFAKAHILF